MSGELRLAALYLTHVKSHRRLGLRVYRIRSCQGCPVNKKKHGISLARAEAFDFESAMYLVDDREDHGEMRFRALGFLDARLHSLVFTRRNERLRVIGLRKATRPEEKEYEESR